MKHGDKWVFSGSTFCVRALLAASWRLERLTLKLLPANRPRVWERVIRNVLALSQFWQKHHLDKSQEQSVSSLESCIANSCKWMIISLRWKVMKSLFCIWDARRGAAGIIAAKRWINPGWAFPQCITMTFFRTHRFHQLAFDENGAGNPVKVFEIVLHRWCLLSVHMFCENMKSHRRHIIASVKVIGYAQSTREWVLCESTIIAQCIALQP